MKLTDINLRDPFILNDGGKYYLYGTRGKTAWGKADGFDVYVSSDLDEWSDPIEVFHKTPDFWSDTNYWAPEVHKYNGKYYMLASFTADGHHRGTQILVSDTPDGTFAPISDGPVTPRDWECLDGTLFVDTDGKPYIVFCHEWTQVVNGEVYAMELSPDLKSPAGEPVLLFRGGDPEWAVPSAPNYVTDGPFLYRTEGGRLLLIWSSFTREGYCEAIVYSESGKVTGPWKHDPRLLFERDGGHGMIFRTIEGELKFVFHQPNSNPNERPHIVSIEERDDTLYKK